MLASDVIDRVRRTIYDTGPTETQRFTDTVLRNYLNDALDEVALWRGEELIQADGTEGTITDITANGDTITILSADWLTPLAAYVSAKCFREDNPDTANAANAQLQYQLWLTALYGHARAAQ